MSGQGNNEPQTSRSASQPPDQKQGGPTDERTDAFVAGGEIHAPEANRERRKPSDNEKHLLDYLTAIFAFIAAIGGVLAAVAGGYQGWVARDAEIAASRAFVISTSVQFVTNEAASSESQPQTDPTKIVVGSRTWLVGARIENVGNTPTRNLHFTALTSFGAPANDGQFEKEIGGRRLKASILIGPHGESVPNKSFLTKVALGHGTAVNGMGIVRYEDIFGYSHLTEFCYYVLPYAIDFQTYPIGQPINYPGIPCAHHNCADDECDADWKRTNQ